MSRATLCLIMLSAPAWAASPYFSVVDYGARADGSADAAPAFRAAIQAAHAAGGGTVYVPAGNYVTGPIELVSNLILNIDAGAALRFPAQRLPFTRGREQGIECLTPVPLIGGHNLENVTITGRGVLTTSNADWLKLMSRQDRSAADPGSAFGAAWEHLLQLLELRRPVPDELYRQVAPELRPSFVRFMESKNILIEGVHLAGSSMWTIHLLYTDNAVVRNVIIETYPGVHTVGIAVDSSRNVRISGCYIDTGDDGIVLKSGKDADGLRVNRPTENVSIDNCTVHRAHGAVTIGSETSGCIRNVVASNITCQGTQKGVRIKSRRGRGGKVEDVRFTGWTMEDVGAAIDVTNFYLMEGEKPSSDEPVSDRTPVFRNIAIANMTINRAHDAISIEGLPEMPIDGLRISDVIATAGAGLKASHTRGLELHNVRIDAGAGPAFLVRDSTELDLDGITTRKPVPAAPVIRLDRCPGALVRAAKAIDGTGVFLSAGPGELKNIVQDNNALAPARKAAEESAGNFWH
jgi:hypothetical protein